MSERPFTLEVMWAAAQSDLPEQLKHVIHVFALHANAETGAAWYGQAELASAIGCSPRELRERLRDIEAAASPAGLEVRERGRPGAPWQVRVSRSPVRLERTARGREGGGRTSDLWRLVLVQSGTTLPLSKRNDSAAFEGEAGTPLPLCPVTKPEEFGGAKRNDSAGESGTPLPRIVGGSSERSSEKRSARSAARGARPRKAAKAAKAAERTEEQRAAHSAVVEAFAVVFEEATGSKLKAFDGADGAAVYRLLERLGWNVEAAIRIVRNAVLSDFGGTTSIRTIASDPNRFAVLRQRDVKPGWKSQSGGSVDLERGRENARRLLAAGGSP